MKKRDLSFTLTEVLIVIVIIGILAVLAVPRFLKTMEKVKVDEAISTLNLIRTGQKIYFLEQGYFSGKVGGNETIGISELNIDDPNTSYGYFDYKITSDAGDTVDFEATAKRKLGAPSPYDIYIYTIRKDGNITSNSPF